MEEFSFSTPDVVEVSSMSSYDDFQDPPSKPPIPKPTSTSFHKTKVGQQFGLLLKPLSDRVDNIGKTQQALDSNQKKMMDQISTMKMKQSSNFSIILAILSNLQGDKVSRFEDHLMSSVTKKRSF